jgi:hypothetical protein
VELLGRWESPLGIPAAVKALASADPRSLEEVARYLRLFPAEEKVRQALKQAWEAAPGAEARCPLAFALVRIGQEPDAVELAALLRSRCRHDMTILGQARAARVARLVEWLATAKATTRATRGARGPGVAVRAAQAAPCRAAAPVRQGRAAAVAPD